MGFWSCFTAGVWTQCGSLTKIQSLKATTKGGKACCRYKRVGSAPCTVDTMHSAIQISSTSLQSKWETRWLLDEQILSPSWGNYRVYSNRLGSQVLTGAWTVFISKTYLKLASVIKNGRNVPRLKTGQGSGINQLPDTAYKSAPPSRITHNMHIHSFLPAASLATLRSREFPMRYWGKKGCK